MHEASETRKWRQRKDLQADHLERSLNFLHFKPNGPSPTVESKPLDRTEGVLQHYDINGKVICSGRQPIPIPEQTNKAHWTCQVSGLTGNYNIITNKNMHPALDQRRHEELARLRSNGLQAAGAIQPQRVVSSYDPPGFVPIKAREVMGERERFNRMTF